MPPMSDQPAWKKHTTEAARLLRLSGRTAAQERQAHELLFSYTSQRLTRDLAFRWPNLNEDDRDEVVVDTLHKFIKAPPEQATAFNWALTTALNGANDRWRKLHAQRRHGEGDDVSLDIEHDDDEAGGGAVAEPAGTDNIERTVSMRECMALKFEEMKADPKGQTYVHVLLMIAEELEVDDIAERLNTTYNAAKARMHEARKAAQRFFAACKD